MVTTYIQPTFHAFVWRQLAGFDKRQIDPGIKDLTVLPYVEVRLKGLDEIVAIVRSESVEIRNKTIEPILRALAEGFEEENSLDPGTVFFETT